MKGFGDEGNQFFMYFSPVASLKLPKQKAQSKQGSLWAHKQHT